MLPAKMPKVIIIAFLLLLLSNPISMAYEKIELTTDEMSWIKAHPEIRFGFAKNIEPFLIVDQDGSLSGFLIDFVDEMNRRTGLNILIVPGIWTEIQTKAEQKELDGIQIIHPNLADRLGLLKTKSVINAYPAIFARNESTFQGLDDLIGKTLSQVKGAHYADHALFPYIHKIKIKPTETALQSLQWLFEGKADFAIGLSTDNFHISKYQLINISPVHVFWNNPIAGVMGVRSDWPQLVPILDKAINSFSEDELNAIIAKWIKTPHAPTVNLAPREKDWIKAHPVITLSIDNTYPPLNYSDENGNMIGLSVDYIGSIAEKLGVAIDFQGSI